MWTQLITKKTGMIVIGAGLLLTPISIIWYGNAVYQAYDYFSYENRLGRCIQDDKENDKKNKLGLNKNNIFN